MKEHKSYLKIILIVIISIMVVGRFYRPHEPDYYDLFLNDVSATSLIEIVHGDRLIFQGKLGRDGVTCLSSYKEKGWIPHASNIIYNVKIEGNNHDHYITLDTNDGVVHSYQLWSKISSSSSSFRSKTGSVDLLTRCAVTMKGVVGN
ncbi:hypothetical protein [Vibrio mangrovi]|uniref:Uncharacterized protein n=1 Tax=Vibrio mangrovi TaxID=474394 RepID=A0A1Y6IXC7_9VIBR|nr:hypothetical protein [Vibrio mangrovi]MDW6002145.1 hypothetical protein [Vibrio mangrovi]SMS01490.1 hypothetical protein VIM7927_02786 [Vibrio mangrovi]